MFLSFILQLCPITAYNIGICSTMRKNAPRQNPKQKKIGKKDRRQRENALPNEQTEDFDVQEALDHEEPLPQHTPLQKYESPEDLKKRLAREALSKIEKPNRAKLQDDFFIIEEEQGKRADTYDEGIAEKLKQDYLRKQNKVYEQIGDRYAVEGFQEPIEYKGHTLCITAFEITTDFIYSCSKDRSIIKWDRETKQKQFLSLGKDPNHHRSDIIALSLHSNENVLATAGDDCQIKLWDTRNLQLIDTLRGHKNTINGIKFGTNSNNLCSISADLTLKQWDFSQRGLIQTFYEHNAEILDIDCFNGEDFLTSGNDHQVISWKTEKQTKIVYKGHDYAIDRVRAINLEQFVTACQDGSVNLWNAKKNKPIFKFAQAHQKGWISALDNLKQTNIFATAGIDHTVKVWGIQGEAKGINLLRELPVNGIVTDLKIREDLIAATECDELRLGRWHTDKCRNKIKIFKVKAN